MEMSLHTEILVSLVSKMATMLLLLSMRMLDLHRWLAILVGIKTNVVNEQPNSVLSMIVVLISMSVSQSKQAICTNMEKTLAVILQTKQSTAYSEEADLSNSSKIYMRNRR